LSSPRWLLLSLVCLLILAIPTFYVQAEGSTATVNLEANIVSPPKVITVDSIGIGTTRATLRGRLIDLGTSSSVDVSFGWDTVSHAENPDEYPNWTPDITRVYKGRFQYRITGLTPHTTYYFRSRAVGDTMEYGEELSFTTHPCFSWWYWWYWFFPGICK
jgi:hypothetical protein